MIAVTKKAICIMPKMKANGLSRRLSVCMAYLEFDGLTSSQTCGRLIITPHEEQATKQARRM
jgi:hypothetical protein